MIPLHPDPDMGALPGPIGSFERGNVPSFQRALWGSWCSTRGVRAEENCFFSGIPAGSLGSLPRLYWADMRGPGFYSCISPRVWQGSHIVLIRITLWTPRDLQDVHMFAGSSRPADSFLFSFGPSSRLPKAAASGWKNLFPGLFHFRGNARKFRSRIVIGRQRAS